MPKEKVSFEAFLETVAPEHQAFIGQLNNQLMELGCDVVIKEAKSGYAASYQWGRKRS